MGDSARPTVALVEALSPLDVRGSDLLGALTHQLRTPLTSALGYLELLADGSFGPITPEQADALRTVEASVRRLSGLVDELDPAVAAPARRAAAQEPGPRDGA
ncbi:hypothetical protein KDL01_26430 [Actinospica durhamensis]|uniref:histidine kinase n=1 Tax=Actinospica durhamensis TaxID=1508375 RepID=A0A941ETC3_9ACTN|nr:histidine kinase dimerization/phospho-acceptor domain-containing protein [Actinospica durhamensis]MBR7836843.1 hypothetical protein [Actinospica durhamensis]